MSKEKNINSIINSNPPDVSNTYEALIWSVSHLSLYKEVPKEIVEYYNKATKRMLSCDVKHGEISIFNTGTPDEIISFCTDPNNEIIKKLTTEELIIKNKITGLIVRTQNYELHPALRRLKARAGSAHKRTLSLQEITKILDTIFEIALQQNSSSIACQAYYTACCIAMLKGDMPLSSALLNTDKDYNFYGLRAWDRTYFIQQSQKVHARGNLGWFKFVESWEFQGTMVNKRQYYVIKKKNLQNN